MCGIAGIFHLQKPGPISLETLKAMMGAQISRGPDEAGIYMDDRIGMGHTRLSIIDLTGGTQPIHNEDKTLWIVFNGEIFNYPELKENLLQKGHKFYTSSDTEVILHLYEEKGSRCLDDLNGQFAFSIWDSVKNELFLARDRVGILPLHYTIQDGCLIFSSTVKSIFMMKDISRRIDPKGIEQIFTFWTTLPGRTIFEGIYELPPGHLMKISRGDVCIKKYWSPDFSSPDEQYDMTVDEVCQRVEELLVDAIRIRLRADVPVGSYLSGGLDSSGVTALVKRRFNNSLKTYGIGFEEDAFDESDHQDRMISHLDVDHSKVIATNEKIGATFPNVLWHCEMPILRTAPIPLFLLSSAVNSEGYKVVLTGEGADEIFGGYNIFQETKVRVFWAKQPDSRLRPLLLGKLYPYIFDDPRSRGNLQSFFGQGLDGTGDPFFSHRIRWNNTSRIKAFFSEDMRAEIGDYCCFKDLEELIPESFPSWDHVSRAQYLETTIFMSNYLLSCQGDRVAMAHSVEVRPPYLDHRLIEFMGRVPSKWKIFGLSEKFLLKRVFRDILPEKIVNRRKHPYRAPIGPSLLSGLDSYGGPYMSGHSVKKNNFFDPDKVSRLVNKIRLNRRLGEIDGMALTGILSTQLIYEQFVSCFPSYPIRQVYPTYLVDRRKICS